MQHINESQISEIKQLLATPKKIAIIPHRNVDGDAMGSTLGLYHILKQLNHQITVVVPNEIPDYLQWIPGINDATLIFEGAHTDKATSTLTPNKGAATNYDPLLFPQDNLKEEIEKIVK